MYCVGRKGLFRAPKKHQDKAGCAANGCSLGKYPNTVLALLGGSFRLSHNAAVCCVVLA